MSKQFRTFQGVPFYADGMLDRIDPPPCQQKSYPACRSTLHEPDEDSKGSNWQTWYNANSQLADKVRKTSDIG